MFQTAVIASGSKGNCVLVRTEKTAILVDAGISAKKVWNALHALKISEHQLKAVLITHEHSDHIYGAGAISRLLHIPVYITADTYNECSSRLGKMDGRIVHITAGKPFTVGDISIHPFTSPHDAVDSVNFTFTTAAHPQRKLAVSTDVGYATLNLVQHLQNCTTIILESNHDEQLLHEGPYPWHLKQRIRSNHGHLSNNQAVGVITQVLHSGLKNLVLAHLSETNNLPHVAHKTMADYLTAINSDIRLLVAEQHNHTPLIDV